jgi:putative nucleotidyltransferase with HDIG domain
MAIPAALLEGIDHLEPLPVTLQKLVAILSDEDINMQEVADIVEYDAAVAANILKVANSAVYAGRFRIERVRDAVVRLGTTTLLDIAMGGYLRSLKVSAPLYDLTENDFWLHTAAASLAVKALVKEVGNRCIPHLAGIAALVHDIGKLIMVRYLTANVADIHAQVKQTGCSFVEAERALFGCDHAEVGGAMAHKWNFPAQIVQAIEQHHAESPQGDNLTVDAVMVANLTAKSVGAGLGAEGMNLQIDSRAICERVGLTVKGFQRVCAQTAIWLLDFKAKYGIQDQYTQVV